MGYHLPLPEAVVVVVHLLAQALRMVPLEERAALFQQQLLAAETQRAYDQLLLQEAVVVVRLTAQVTL